MEALPQNQPGSGYEQEEQPPRPVISLPHSNTRSGARDKGESTPRSPTADEMEGEEKLQGNGNPQHVFVPSHSVTQNVLRTSIGDKPWSDEYKDMNDRGNDKVGKTDEHDPELSLSDNSSVAMHQDHYAVNKVTNMYGMDDANKLEIMDYDENGQQNAEKIMNASETKGKHTNW